MSKRASETCDETTERRESQIVPRVCTLVLFIIIGSYLRVCGIAHGARREHC